MLPCTGCRHLVHAWGQDVCSATDSYEQRTNQYSGRVEHVVTWRPSLTAQRASSGACQPERLLYEPGLRQLFIEGKLLSHLWRSLTRIKSFVLHSPCLATGGQFSEVYENASQCHGVRRRKIAFCDVCGKTLESDVEYFEVKR